MDRKANVFWLGSLEKGTGKISTDSGALREVEYTFNTRFGSGRGSNPEELIAAAHASCYSMALANELSKKGATPEKIETAATVTIAKQPTGWTITGIHLDVSAQATNIADDEFQNVARLTKEICPVSRVLKTQIELTARLVEGVEQKAG